MNKLPKHLGGHLNVTHIDKGVLEFLKKHLDIKTFLDIGCGPGGMLDIASQLGINAYGIDGDYTLNHPKILIHDFTMGPIKKDLLSVKTFDIGWSVEFLEHVDEKYIDNIFSAINLCKSIVITHALPNKKGYHHVNCQLPEYWIKLFNNNGFEYDDENTKKMIKFSTMRREFMKNTGKLFHKL